MFDLDQLRSFTVLAAEKHFGRAAHRLFITQSALTRRIQQLEAELDVLLLNRSSRTVALTAAGETFLTHATAILSSSQEAVRAAREATGQPIGALSIGFDGATTYAFLPQLIARARDTFPALRLDFTEAGSQAQMTEVLFHRLDLGLVRPLPHDKALQMACVRREDLALALPITHRLAGKRRPQLQDLEDEAFVGYSEAGSYLRDLIGGELTHAGVTPRLVHEMGRAQAILSLVSTGAGLAIVPSDSRNACFDNVVFRPLPLRVKAELHAVWREDNRNPLLEPFRAMLERIES